MKFLRLQPLTPAQLEAVVELDRMTLGGLWSLDGYQREIDSPNSELLALEEIDAHTGNAIAMIGIGCLWEIADEAHITILAIHPDYRHQGLGQLMLYALLNQGWRRNLEWATLEVRPSNQSAIALYEKFGFQRVGTRRKYYQDTGEDALILWNNGLKHLEFRKTLHDWHQTICDRLGQSGWVLTSTPLTTPPVDGE